MLSKSFLTTRQTTSKTSDAFRGLQATPVSVGNTDKKSARKSNMTLNVSTSLLAHKGTTLKPGALPTGAFETLLDTTSWTIAWAYTSHPISAYQSTTSLKQRKKRERWLRGQSNRNIARAPDSSLQSRALNQLNSNRSRLEACPDEF